MIPATLRAIAARLRTIADEVAARGERGCIVAIVCDRGDRYFAPMRWEKKYVW